MLVSHFSASPKIRIRSSTDPPSLFIPSVVSSECHLLQSLSYGHFFFLECFLKDSFVEFGDV